MMKSLKTFPVVIDVYIDDSVYRIATPAEIKRMTAIWHSLEFQTLITALWLPGVHLAED